MKNRKLNITNLKEFFNALTYGHFAILAEIENIVRIKSIPDEKINIDGLEFIFKGSNLAGTTHVYFYEFVINIA